MIDEHARGEQVERENTAFIEKRHAQRVAEEGDRPVEEMWAASARRHADRQRREEEAARYVWHAGQAERLRRTMGELVAFHERQAEKLMNQTDRRETA